MRRFAVLLLVLATAIVGFLGGGRIIGAQEGTPAAEEPEGVAFEELGFGMPAAVPGYALGMARVTFAPGYSAPGHPDPGAIVGYVESGAFAITFESGTLLVTRAGMATPEAATPEAAEPGTEVVVRAGDSFFAEDLVTSSERTVGDEPAVLLLSELFPTEEGTPTP